MVLVMVSCVCHLDWAWGTQMCGQTLHRLCLWGVFRTRVTFVSADCAQQPALPGVGGPCPVSRKLDQNKRADFLPQSTRGPFLPKCLQLGQWASSAFGLELNHQLFWGLSLPAFGLECTPPAPRGTPAFSLHTLGALSLRICVSQFLLINQSIDKCIQRTQ